MRQNVPAKSQVRQWSQLYMFFFLNALLWNRKSLPETSFLSFETSPLLVSNDDAQTGCGCQGEFLRSLTREVRSFFFRFFFLFSSTCSARHMVDCVYFFLFLASKLNGRLAREVLRWAHWLIGAVVGLFVFQLCFCSFFFGIYCFVLVNWIFYR